MEFSPINPWLPRKTDMARIVAPAGHLVSNSECRHIARYQPLSFLRVTRPEVDLSVAHLQDRNNLAETSRRNLDFLAHTGHFQKMAEPSFLVHEITCGKTHLRGLVCGIETGAIHRNRFHLIQHGPNDSTPANALNNWEMGVVDRPVVTFLQGARQLLETIEKHGNLRTSFQFQTADGATHHLAVYSPGREQTELIQQSDLFFFDDTPNLAHLLANLSSRQSRLSKVPVVLYEPTHLELQCGIRTFAALQDRSPRLLREQIKTFADLHEASMPTPRETSPQVRIFLDHQWFSIHFRGHSGDSASANIRAYFQRIEQELLGNSPTQPNRTGSILRTFDEIPSAIDRITQRNRGFITVLTNPGRDEIFNECRAGRAYPPRTFFLSAEFPSGLIINPLVDSPPALQRNA